MRRWFIISPFEGLPARRKCSIHKRMTFFSRLSLTADERLVNKKSLLKTGDLRSLTERGHSGGHAPAHAKS
jgi:hypothetical protein